MKMPTQVLLAKRQDSIKEIEMRLAAIHQMQRVLNGDDVDRGRISEEPRSANPGISIKR